MTTKRTKAPETSSPRRKASKLTLRKETLKELVPGKSRSEAIRGGMAAGRPTFTCSYDRGAGCG